MTYDLVEIFESLQGEGRNTGRPCLFLRFAGCNLACPWCDTSIERRFSMTLDELVAELSRYKAKSVILTGGEPTVRAGMSELVAALKAKGYWVAIETNGTSEPEWFALLDYIACSPKVEFPEAVALTRANEVRVVASSEAAVDFCKIIRGRIAAEDYYISPCDHEGKVDLATAKIVLSRLDGWSLSVQLHKILGFR